MTRDTIDRTSALGASVLAAVFAVSLSLAGCADDHGHDDRRGHDHAAGHDHGDDEHDHDEHVVSTLISADAAQASGIRGAPVAGAVIRREQVVQGLLVPIEGRSARVVARFPGPVRQVHVATGDRVHRGQVLAVVESNISLSDYTVTAPIDGTVLNRSVAVGDFAGESPLFEIADLSSLWVDLHLFGVDGERIEPGLPLLIERLSDGAQAELVLERILPGAATASQSTVARATLDNHDGRWRPGSAVHARVTVAEREVPLAVPLAAIQRMDGVEVVFVREGELYSARSLRLGERDADRVEVLAGLDAGEIVVVEQSYLIMADIGKAGAAHEH